MSDSHIYGENRGVGYFQLDLALHDEVQEVFAVPPEQFRFTNFEVGGDFAVGLYGDPDTTMTEFDRDADPVPSKFGLTALDSDEIFSDGEWVFSFGLDPLVEPLGLLLVGRVEFNVGVASEEPLESIIFVSENLTLDIGQTYDLCPDDLLHLHHSHHFPVYRFCVSDFRGGHRKYSASIHPPYGGLLEVVLINVET